MGNRLRTEYSNFFMLTFRTNPVCSLDYGPGLALNSWCTPVWRLRAHTLYSEAAQSPVPELHSILFAFKNMYTIPHSLSTPSPHSKDTPAGIVRHYSYFPSQVQQAKRRVSRKMYTRLSLSHILYFSTSKSLSPVGDYLRIGCVQFRTGL